MENLKLIRVGRRNSKTKDLPDYGGAHHIQITATSEKDGVERSLPTCSLTELCNLMKLRGTQARDKLISEYGGTEGLCQRLRSDPDRGLDEDDVEDIRWRQQTYGTNVIPSKESKMFLWFIWEAMQDVTLVILIVAALVSLGLSFYKAPHRDSVVDHDPTESRAGYIESIGILIAVVIIVLVTAFINWTKDVQFRGLQSHLQQTCKYSIIRSGEILSIPVSDIVVGDICIVKYGDIIPADGILISSNDLNVDESSHTGESDDVIKTVDTDIILYSVVPELREELSAIWRAKQAISNDECLVVGTNVIEGSGKILVTSVGINSSKGVMYSLLGVTYGDENKPEEKRSILHQKVVKIALQITYAGSALAALTVITLIIRFSVETFAVKKLPWEMFYLQDYVSYVIMGITVLAVAVPEGLPLAIVLSLAYSIRKMMLDNNLVRHLDACETMGNATTVCCDKTGTLTANRMTVVQSFLLEKHCTTVDHFDHLPPDVARILASAISINSSYTNTVKGESWGKTYNYSSDGPIGNKTECAMLSFVSAFGDVTPGVDELRQQTPESSFVKVYTFNSSRKWMATVVPSAGQPSLELEPGVDQGKGYRVYVKGAPEMVLPRCNHIIGGNASRDPLTAEGKKYLESEVIDKMASQGLRTICIAYRDVISGDWSDEDSIINDLTCITVVGIEDPLRPEVPLSVYQCQKAGITVRMVTGDSVKTAMFVAKKCGIIKPGDDSLVLDGAEFNKLVRRNPNEPVSQELMDTVWPRLRVLARSSPEDKYNLVKGIMESRLNHDREIVAVTGDGTNDAPALKKAHVGLAMGKAGTDIAKEASDIIIIDDNFASIVKAVVWGRHVYDSIAKFLQFQLTINVVAVTLVLLAAIITADSPLKGIQMLWVNLLMDTLASLSLATERPSEGLLNRRPYGYTEPIVSRLMLRNILCHAAYELTVLLVLLFAGESLLGINSGRSKAMHGLPNVHYTFIFNSFVMMILFNEICARKLDSSLNVFAGLHRSPVFIVIWLTSFVSQVLIVQFGGTVLFTAPLSLDLWLWSLFLGISDLLFSEVVCGVSLAVTWCAARNRNMTSTEGNDELEYITSDNKPLYTK